VTRLLFKDEVYAIVGSAIEVHRELGNGFLEAVYQEAMELELASKAIPFHAQQSLPICYKGQQLKKEYIADLVCYNQIIVELKAMDCITKREESQLINYLNAVKMRVGVLINFGSVGKLEWKRFVV